MKKVVLAVIDALKPEMLERAIAAGVAPTLGHLLAEGSYTPNCVSAFPSLTPVCAATIATGATPDRHRIPGINWFYRPEARYIEYGSSFRATRAFGILRSLTDTVYGLNQEHLAAEVRTLFESLDDADFRTAGTTFLIYRGRHLQLVSKQTSLSRIATSTMFRKPVHGPRELYYADLFATRRTGCDSTLGLPGRRDQHAGCVGAYMVEHDLFDFLLLSLPDNDSHSHKHGPDAQVESVAIADQQLARLAEPVGGIERLLDDHAVIVVADHSQSYVNDRISLTEIFSQWRYVKPNDPAPEVAEIALCPGARSALIYVLDPDRKSELLPELCAALRHIEGVDLLVWGAGNEVVVTNERGELRFAPDGDLVDTGGASWSVEGELMTLRAELSDGRIETPTYPNAFARLWQAVNTPTTGDLLVSLAPGYEFSDWGGGSHLGGGSHGSLHRCDSLAPLVCCGIGPDSFDQQPLWTLADIAPMIRNHFGVI